MTSTHQLEPKPNGRSWFKHGFMNTLEQGITRVADGLTTLFLIWFLTPELFSKLAMAQAVVAPLLLFFLAPETVLYRDFAVWKEAGLPVLAGRLHAFRVFGYGKGIIAIGISLGFGAFLGWEWVVSLIWAFSLALAPQVAGPDREFLRLSLRLETLSLLSLYQKTVLFLGTFLTLQVQKDSPALIQLVGLAGVGVFSAASSAYLARYQAMVFLRSEGLGEISTHSPSQVTETLVQTLRDFSIWQHLQGVILNWVQTMDLLCLGWVHFPARTLGLYASVLKLVNFSNFAPLALTNAFGVWIGRKHPEQGRDLEVARVKKLSALLIGGILVQGVIFWALSPYLLELLSHGRWSATEQEEMLGWFSWILLGNMILTSTFLFTHWITVRSSVKELLFKCYLPWGVFSLIVYWVTSKVSLDSQSPLWVARQNGLIGVFFCILLFFVYRSRIRRSGALASVGDN